MLRGNPISETLMKSKVIISLFETIRFSVSISPNFESLYDSSKCSLEKKEEKQCIWRTLDRRPGKRVILFQYKK